MIIVQDRIESSKQYVYDSLELYRIADEYGTHDEQRSDYKNKIKWRNAFIFLVQGFELILKSALEKINPLLVNENIDDPKNRKTVTFVKALGRIKAFNATLLNDYEESFFIKCYEIRNNFVHDGYSVESADIKNKYSKMLEKYIEIYSFVTQSSFESIEYHSTILELKEFANNYTVFRGFEIRKDDLERIETEIKEMHNYCFYKDNNGRLIKRIRYGDEQQLDKYKKLYSEYPQPTYCGDCGAKIGEYHLEGCDIEVCPVCFGQKLSCDCDLVLCDENGNEYVSQYY